MVCRLGRIGCLRSIGLWIHVGIVRHVSHGVRSAEDVIDERVNVGALRRDRNLLNGRVAGIVVRSAEKVVQRLGKTCRLKEDEKIEEMEERVERKIT